MSSQTTVESSVAFSQLEKPTIHSYFATINQGKFQETARLFALSGRLLAPFEQPIVGREAIAKYLSQEAAGMSLFPDTAVIEADTESTSIKVVGKVSTILFKVNVAWLFVLNTEQQITQVRIKLIASPQELLGLKNIRENS